MKSMIKNRWNAIYNTNSQLGRFCHGPHHTILLIVNVDHLPNVQLYSLSDVQFMNGHSGSLIHVKLNEKRYFTARFQLDLKDFTRKQDTCKEKPERNSQ